MADTAASNDNVTTLRRKVGEAEWDTRVNLAAAFRAAHHLGWNLTPQNHITARIPDEPDHFLMNPAGYAWNEITASLLLKFDTDGNILSDTDLRPGPAGLNFHSAILSAKRDTNCVLHVHPESGVAVSATREGLIFVDQTACAIYGQVAYHDFEGLAEDEDEAPRIIADLGDKATMIMWNHGLLSVGRTIGEAFSYMQRLISTCDLQTRLMSMGAEIRELSPELCDHTSRQMAARRGNAPFGERDWPMYVRMANRLDPSFRD